MVSIALCWGGFALASGDCAGAAPAAASRRSERPNPAVEQQPTWAFSHGSEHEQTSAGIHHAISVDSLIAIRHWSIQTAMNSSALVSAALQTSAAQAAFVIGASCAAHSGRQSRLGQSTCRARRPRLPKMVHSTPIIGVDVAASLLTLRRGGSNRYSPTKELSHNRPAHEPEEPGDRAQNV